MLVSCTGCECRERLPRSYSCGRNHVNSYSTAPVVHRNAAVGIRVIATDEQRQIEALELPPTNGFKRSPDVL